MQRNTREDMNIPGNVFDCQRARRVPEELHNDSGNLATPSGIQRREGIEKIGSKEPLQTTHLPCFSVRAREKCLDERNCLMSMTNHAAGIGTCSQSGLTIPSYPSSEMHLGKFLDTYGISELDCKLPNIGLLEGEESHARFAVDQGNRSSQIAGRPHHSEVNNKQRFP